MIFIVGLLVVIVEVASILLKLTGLDIHTARFQALSAITGTGFTTKETELIMSHKNRRQIIMVLMILGPVAMISILGSLLMSLRGEYLAVQAIILLISLLVIINLSTNKKAISFLHRVIQSMAKKKKYPRRIILEETLQLSKDYGVCELRIDKNSKFADKTLDHTNFKDLGFMVLAIERGGDLITIPRGSDKLVRDDILIVFGNVNSIKEAIHREVEA